MITTDVINQFREFLNSSWEIMEGILSNKVSEYTDSIINDWLQANWELLVETSLMDNGKFIEHYGEGADYHGKSCRILEHESLPDYRILVKNNNTNKLFDVLNTSEININSELSFEQFVCFENGYYFIKKPFTHVLVTDLTDNVNRVIDSNMVIYELKEII